MHHHARTIARYARFNKCPIVSIHRDCNMKGQAQWDLLIGADQFSGFRELTFPTKAEAFEAARDIARASDGFIEAIYAQRGGICDMRKVSLT